jgi:Na+/melibiose symporter-like transporter
VIARRQNAVVGGGAIVLVLIAAPLYAEFFEPGSHAWNAFLTLLVIGLVAAAFLLQRFFMRHAGEVGEARFDTRNRTDVDG